jgi:hypothetical protein
MSYSHSPWIKPFSSKLFKITVLILTCHSRGSISILTLTGMFADYSSHGRLCQKKYSDNALDRKWEQPQT